MSHSSSSATTPIPSKDLPFPSTIDKLEECEFFLGTMMAVYHQPREFRFNLNAFIQALRSVTFMLQSEDSKPAGFAEWYEQKQGELRANALLRRFVDARNLVVKQSMLETKSYCQMGLFRGRAMKLAIGGEVPPQVASHEYLQKFKVFATGLFIDDAHSAIGEQLGVHRKWVVEAIGPGDVVEHCITALEAIKAVVVEAVGLAGVVADGAVEVPWPPLYTVLLESDLDPDLPRRWGW